MEEVYRRRTSGSASARSKTAKTFARSGNYKKMLIQQALLCLLIFIGCLFTKLSSNPDLDIVKNSIQLILNTQTDFNQIPKQIRKFVQSLLPGEEARSLEGDDLLTSLTKPVEAPITSPFGLRTHPTDGTENFHYGVDLGAPEGEKIKCAADGTAAEVGENADYGNYILVQHADSVCTLYAHCQEVLPTVGDAISAGQVIATVGATGNTTGPHLHFEIRDGDTWLDPERLLNFESHD